MPDYGDIDGLPPVTLDPTPDLASLAWPWDQPAPGGAAVTPGAGDVAAAAPVAPDAVTPDGAVVPAGAPGEPAPAAPPPAVDQLPAMQPGLGIPRATLDPLVPPEPPSPLPAAAPPITPPGPSPDLGFAPPVAAAPAVEQPLTPTAGAPAPFEPPPTSLPIAPLAEPGLPPSPEPLAPPLDLAPPLTPDALTGAGGTPADLGGPVTLTPEQRYAAVASEYQRDPNKLLDRLEQPGALDADTQRYLDEFAARDPAGAAVMQQRMRDAGATRAAAARLKLEQDNFDAQKANMDRLKAARAVAAKKSAEIEAEATKIAETKVGYHPSTFQRIAGVIAAAIGGLYQGRTGSARNPGLDALNDVINRDIEQQRLNLANRRDILAQKRSALGELTARNNDEYMADETMRLAAYKFADQQIALAQTNFAPDGTRGLNLAMMRAGLNSQIAASKEARDAKLLDRAIKRQDAARQQQIADQTNWHNRAQIGLGYAQLKEQSAQREETRAQRLADKEAEQADKEAERRRQFAIGGLPRVQVGPDNKPVIGPDGKPVITNDDLRNADGRVWQAASSTEHDKLSGMKTSATSVIANIDEILAIRDRVGGESKSMNSDERQRLDVLKADTLNLKKAGTQGMSSDKDMDQIADSAGVGDAASWRDQRAKLLQARALVERNLNHAFSVARYTGPTISFPPSLPAKNTADDEATQRLIQKPNESFNDVVKAKLDDLQATRGYAIDLNNPADRDLYQQVVRDAHESHNPDASIEQRAQITDLGAKASRGDADSRATLQTIARQGHTGALRALAQNQLDSSGRAHIATLTERGMGDNDAAVAARRELQQLTHEAPSLALRSLAQDQLNAIGRAKSQAAAAATAAASAVTAPAVPIDVPPELRLGGGQ